MFEDPKGSHHAFFATTARSRRVTISSGIIYLRYMRERRRVVDDPYAKPWVAEDAAKNVVKKAVADRLDPDEVYEGRADIHADGYRATVGKLYNGSPPEEIGRDRIGVTGFTPGGQIFPLPEVWKRVTGEELPPYEPTVEKPKRSRKKKVVTEPAPDEHLEGRYEDTVSGDPWENA
jgi:hypothetical protein